jgi:Family of unknown function (DUF6441)
MTMAVKFELTVDQSALTKIVRAKQRSIARAADAALRETATNAVEEGRSNIAGAGKFGPKWQQGLQFRMVGAQKGGEPKAIIFHRFGFAGVFEHGATIAGKPLLWIPTTPGGPRASRSGKKLTSATVRGKPMLFDANDRDRDRKPLYIGVPSVRIPRKWRITEIVKENAARIGELFRKYLKDT